MHEALLNQVRTAREPREAISLWREITLFGSRPPPADMPQTPEKFMVALEQLEAAELIAIDRGQDGDDWIVKAVYQEPKAKGPEQKALF